MRLLSADRGQSIQVGAVLLFGILIVALAVWQAVGVPNQNEQVEFDHNQEVQQQLTELRGSILSMPGSTVGQSTTVTLGTRYPARAITVNPPPASGTIETVGTTDSRSNITIANTTAGGELGDFWNTTLSDPQTYNTGRIEYQPNYNIYGDAPTTVYGQSVLYNEFTGADRRLALSEQALIDGDRITLVTLNGSLRENRIDSVGIDLNPVSTRTRTIELTNSTAGNITITLPTQLDSGQWDDLLADEERVSDVRPGDGDTVVIELQPGTYDLQLAKVGLGTGVSDETEQYLTDVGGTAFSINSDETQTVTVEARDRFNRPLSGVTINATAENAENDPAFPMNKTTGPDGQARFTYDPAAAAEGQINTLNFTYQPIGEFNSSGPESVQMTVDVTASTSTPVNGSSNVYNVTWATEFMEGTEASDGTLNVTVGSGTPSEIDLAANVSANNRAVEGAAVDFGLTDGAAELSSSTPFYTNSTGTAVAPNELTGLDGLDDGDTLNLYAAAGDDVSRLPVRILKPESEFYPDSVVSGGTYISDFDNMKQDDGTFAEMRGGSGRDPFDVTIATQSVPAGDYTLEIDVVAGSFEAGGVDVTVEDANGVVGTGTISETGLFTLSLDPSVEGELTVQYEAPI